MGRGAARISSFESQANAQRRKGLPPKYHGNALRRDAGPSGNTRRTVTFKWSAIGVCINILIEAFFVPLCERLFYFKNIFERR